MDKQQRLFILDGRRPVPAPGVLEWGDWMMENIDSKDDKTRVARTTLPDGTCVSTVFTGTNSAHNKGAPLVFETAVFGSLDGSIIDEHTCKYATWEDAEDGHQEMVSLLMGINEKTRAVWVARESGYNFTFKLSPPFPLRPLYEFEIYLSHHCLMVTRHPRRVIRARKRRNRIYLNARHGTWETIQEETAIASGNKIFVGPLTYQKLLNGDMREFLNRVENGRR